MPKVELHRHLEGSLRLSTLTELTALRNPQAPPPPRDALIYATPTREFLTRFWHHQAVFDSYEHIERIAFETVEDCARDNIRLLELRYSPHFIAIGHPDLEFELIHASVVRGVQRGCATYPQIAVGLIGIVDRMQTPAEAAAAMAFFIAHAHEFVAVDLANDEIKYPAAPFAPLFAQARAAGLRVTVHAGETTLPQAPGNVREAVELLGAVRVGHGIAAARDAAVLQLLRERGTVLEVCPVSNWLVGVVPTLAEHPLPKLIDAGVACTVSTDDPGLFGHSLSQEYAALLAEGLVTFEQLEHCNANAAAACFLPESDKQRCWYNNL